MALVEVKSSDSSVDSDEDLKENIDQNLFKGFDFASQEIQGNLQDPQVQNNKDKDEKVPAKGTPTKKQIALQKIKSHPKRPVEIEEQVKGK